MPCAISCFISGVFIIGMIYFYYMTDKSQIVKHYKEQLPHTLQIRYEKIAKERMMISLHGYGLGLILSLLIIYFNYKFKNIKLNTLSLVCTVLATCFLTNYFYYILSPKSDWMLNHIHSGEQTKAWLQMYREMSYNYHMGMALGIIAVGIIAFAFRN
jgi:uncharacterized protein YacL